MPTMLTACRNKVIVAFDTSLQLENDGWMLRLTFLEVNSSVLNLAI